MTNVSLVLSALADPTRRQLFEHICRRPQPVSQLCTHVKVSRPAVSQHLKVLREAGLVRDRAEGTRRISAVNPAGLAMLRAWLDKHWVETINAATTSRRRNGA